MTCSPMVEFCNISTLKSVHCSIVVVLYQSRKSSTEKKALLI